MPSKLNVSQAVETLLPIIGEYVWFVRCVDDRVLRLEFGAPHLIVREPMHTASTYPIVVELLSNRRLVIPTGKWSLFVGDGLWSVETLNHRCDRLTPDKSEIDKCLNQLEGQKLLSVECMPPTYDWVFKFDLLGTLAIKFHRDLESDTQWTMFFEAGGHLAYVGPDDVILEEAV
jgi:hypothetical protein